MNNNQELVVHYTTDEYLRIEDPGRGREIWTSGEKFGGSASYMDNIDSFDRGQDNFAKNRYFLPQRIYVVDLDKDGKYEVITPKNKESITRCPVCKNLQPATEVPGAGTTIPQEVQRAEPVSLSVPDITVELPGLCIPPEREIQGEIKCGCTIRSGQKDSTIAGGARGIPVLLYDRAETAPEVKDPCVGGERHSQYQQDKEPGSEARQVQSSSALSPSSI